jgi:hypothetical protein
LSDRPAPDHDRAIGQSHINKLSDFAFDHAGGWIWNEFTHNSFPQAEGNRRSRERREFGGNFYAASSALTPSLVRCLLSCCPLAKVETTNSQGRRIGIGAEPKSNSEKERAMAASEVICRTQC